MSEINIFGEPKFPKGGKGFVVYKPPRVQLVAQDSILLEKIAQIVGETAEALLSVVKTFTDEKRGPFSASIVRIRLRAEPTFLDRYTDKILLDFMHYIYAMKKISNDYLVQILRGLDHWLKTDMKRKIPFKCCLCPDQADDCMCVYVHFPSTLVVELSFCIVGAGLKYELIKVTFTK
jgi:hypothetical protein